MPPPKLLDHPVYVLKVDSKTLRRKKKSVTLHRNEKDFNNKHYHTGGSVRGFGFSAGTRSGSILFLAAAAASRRA